jgi:hypothetical protein
VSGTIEHSTRPLLLVEFVMARDEPKSWEVLGRIVEEVQTFGGGELAKSVGSGLLIMVKARGNTDGRGL